MSERPILSREGAPGLEPLLVPAPETRRLLGGISARKLSQMVASGELPSVRIGRRRLFPMDGLRRYVADRAERAT
ncbi:MAG: helix-turn-helix domain-containing protein [Phycisphaerales bacterium]|nr:helix-turn-helix domain-containing protein [Phycisphaerales bacterium]